jgi:hypothetical protein
VDIPRGSAQLLAFVALHRPAVDRVVVAGTFWPNASERRAYAALRSALARLEGANRAVLRISPLTLSLAKGVAVDFLERRPLPTDYSNRRSPPPSRTSAPPRSPRCRRTCFPTGTTTGLSWRQKTGASCGFTLSRS